MELGAGLQQERASGGHRGPFLVGIGGASGGIGGHRRASARFQPERMTSKHCFEDLCDILFFTLQNGETLCF